MELIGELERIFASTIYPNRVPIAIGLAILAIVVAIVAVRRGWTAAARRHPRRVLAIALPAVLVGAPLGWYLGSPLFLSTTVDEAPPVTADSGGGPAPSDGDTGGSASVVGRGSFSGADEFHFGRGTALIVESASGQYTVRLEDFEVRNGPDLFVYLSPSADGYAEGAIELGMLKADRGNQNYEVPAGTDLTQVRSVVIWCRAFSVLFATAPLG